MKIMREIIRIIFKIKLKLLPNYDLSTVPIFGKFVRWLLFYLRSGYINVGEHKMYQDPNQPLGPINSDLIINGFWEQSETNYFIKFIQENDIVLDIGANLGYFSLLFAKQVGNKGKVYAFEPEPNLFLLLKKNVEVNQYQNITLINKAVSHQNTSLKLYISEDNIGDHRIYDAEDGRQYIEIDSLKLDDYFADFEPEIRLIKMDIQGAEYEALQGMINLINKNKKVEIVTEFSPYHLKFAGVEPIIYLELIEKLGFTIYILQENGIEKANIQSLLQTYPSDIEVGTNLLCRKEEI
ncbi:hypothetical protein C7H19_13605 [Aphanothece hegewaldii CCALA 016]|uniref:Methyltransferase FkbM domain-containing protein n=1 Tax=Aphanothece hegewaldii CCALA 016 TaxID=2107694 RepID=A0A2T1LWG2_9CHRO|nr:FkbM family methyltransferase [Aphanothece hegewaldii]PSF36238.1 hypothetical protein C7H19_13605 [Aphanothece hegewaldii CCALA 016]